MKIIKSRENESTIGAFTIENITTQVIKSDKNHDCLKLERTFL